MRSASLHGLLVASAAALVLLVRLGAPALWDDDEPKNTACSVAMLEADDWVVPTFNGRLRVEKPPLVNWVQFAGLTLLGRNETGARIGSASLTIGTCLLTWLLGRGLFGPLTGLLGGLAMASCVWTAVGGRAATPDAPLVFCTTLALFCFARGAAPAIRAGTTPRLSTAAAAGVGAACGAAVLAKGPVGLVLPLLALVAFAVWQRSAAKDVPWRTACAGLRPLVVLAAAAFVAAPWYLWVAVRTRGEWPAGFFLVHNVGRFTTTMEGHAGSLLYYPVVIAIGLFPWSIVLAAMITAVAAILRSRDEAGRVDARRPPLRLLACWAAVWIGGFSCSSTKLPGYVWPAYPALAIATGLYLDGWIRGDAGWLRWCRDPHRSLGVVMRVAWSVLAAAGIAIGVGLPVAAARLAPDAGWLGVVGLVPVAAAILGWREQSAGRIRGAVACLAACAVLLVALLAAVAAERLSHRTGTRIMLAGLDRPAQDCSWACFWNVPPSLVFYTGRPVAKLDTAEDVARHLLERPRAHVVIDSRHEPLVADGIPPGCGVLSRTPTMAGHRLVLIGPLPAGDRPLASNP